LQKKLELFFGCFSFSSSNDYSRAVKIMGHLPEYSFKIARFSENLFYFLLRPDIAKKITGHMFQDFPKSKTLENSIFDDILKISDGCIFLFMYS
jgi:hypothetical protein